MPKFRQDGIELKIQIESRLQAEDKNQFKD